MTITKLTAAVVAAILLAPPVFAQAPAPISAGASATAGRESPADFTITSGLDSVRASSASMKARSCSHSLPSARRDSSDMAKLQGTPGWEEMKRYIFERLSDGTVRPKIARVFPFPEAEEAYQFLESNQQIGKVVIRL